MYVAKEGTAPGSRQSTCAAAKYALAVVLRLAALSFMKTHTSMPRDAAKEGFFLPARPLS